MQKAASRSSGDWCSGGGYSLAEAELSLISLARERGPYAYYHLISGMNLPLHSQDYIHAFFEQNAGLEFLTFCGDRIVRQNNPANRLRYWYPMIDWPIKSRFLWKVLRRVQIKILVPLQRAFGVNRLASFERDGMRIGYGSQWFSITDDLAAYLLQNRERIHSLCRDSYLCDEVFLHTCVVNSPFVDRVFVPEGIDDRPQDRQGNLRYINWWDGSPYVWRTGDEGRLMEARDRGYLFSRKFDERVDSRIIEFVIRMVRQERYTGGKVFTSL